MAKGGSIKVLVWVSLLWAIPVSCSIRAAHEPAFDYAAKTEISARAIAQRS